MFEMTLHKVVIHTPYEKFNVKVVLMKQAKRVESTSNPVCSGANPVADFKDEKLPMISTIQREKATKKFKDRKGNMIIQIIKDDKTKSVGVLQLNLIDFIDQANAPTKNGSRQSMKLEKCPDPKAYVEFTVRSVLLTANHTGAETISLGSDGMNSESPASKKISKLFPMVQGDDKRGSLKTTNLVTTPKQILRIF